MKSWEPPEFISREEVIIPGFSAMKPTPKVRLTRFGAGVHVFWLAEKDLPIGIAPSVVRSWNEAIMVGISLFRKMRMKSRVSLRGNVRPN